MAGLGAHIQSPAAVAGPAVGEGTASQFPHADPPKPLQQLRPAGAASPVSTVSTKRRGGQDRGIAAVRVGQQDEDGAGGVQAARVVVVRQLRVAVGERGRDSSA
jgi:hypothetical protein